MFRVVLLLIAWTAAPLAAADPLVVVTSTVPALASGDVVNSSTQVSLGPDDALVLISITGDTVRLSGPHAGPLSAERGAEVAESGGFLESLTEMLATLDGEYEGIAATRNAMYTPEGIPPVWAIPLESDASSHCASPGQRPSFWRATASGVATAFELEWFGSNPGARRLEITAPRYRIEWPADAPVSDRVNYALRSEDHPRIFRLKLVPELESPWHTAVWMFDNGCREQSFLLLQGLMDQAGTGKAPTAK